jgi:hypothetical protein
MLLMICLVVHVAGYPVPVDSPGASNSFDENNPIAVAAQNNKSLNCLSFLSYAWRIGEAACSSIERAGEDCSPSFDTSPCSLEERRAGGLDGLRIFDKDGKKQEVVAKLKVRGYVGPPADLDYIMPSWFRLRPDDTSDQEEKKKPEKKLEPEVVGGLGDKEKKKSRKKSKKERKSEVVKLMVINDTVPSLHLTFNMENILKMKSGGEEFESKDVGKGEGGENGSEGVSEGVEEQKDEDEDEESGGGEDVDAQDVAILVCVGLVSAFVFCGLAAGCFYLIHLAIKANTVQGPAGTSASSSSGSSSSNFGSTASSTSSTVSAPIRRISAPIRRISTPIEPEGLPDRRGQLDFGDGDIVPGAESSPRAQEWDHTIPMAQFHRDENTRERENTEEREVVFAGQQAGQHVGEGEDDEGEGAGQHVENKTGG